jgi:hypothetical protein
MIPDENTPQPEMVDVSWLISLIGDATKEAHRVANQIARGTAGREVALCITKLQEAKHWAVDASILLNEQSSEDQSNG